MPNYRSELEELKSAYNYRTLPRPQRKLLDMCSNDYLGLGQDEKLYDRFLGTVLSQKFKFGSAASRLLSNNSQLHFELEDKLASLYGKESAVVYNSGYHANVGILSALTSKKDLILADKYVHASIIDGAKLSNATLLRYKHLDYDHLDQLLKKMRSKYDDVIIVSESLFSMDGDIADIPKLIEIKNKYRAKLYIDEAHALGTRGRTGLGISEEQDCIKDIDYILGTFGKSIASIGAYIVCSELVKDYLVNHSRSLIFSTALPPINIAWNLYIIERLASMSDRRKHLKEISQAFAEWVNAEYTSNIIPLIVGDNESAINSALFLKGNGYNVLPIRYPTVPMDTARLRFSLNAGMNLKDLEKLKGLLRF